MVKIRLKRVGRKAKPVYRIVVVDSRARRDGAPLEELGFYNPISKDLKLNKARAQHWVATGAQVTQSTQRLISMAPDTGELVRLPVPEKQVLSKKAKARLKAEQQSAA
jgi:small subunit ribosomal protein S16